MLEEKIKGCCFEAEDGPTENDMLKCKYRSSGGKCSFNLTETGFCICQDKGTKTYQTY